jgi:hypothetical protein
MKIGTLAYATEQGLGILAKSFYDAGVVTDVMVVRHHSRPTNEQWYPGARQTLIRPFNADLAQSFCSSMDVMLFFETPFDWTLLDYCRRKGVRTVLMPMYECMPKQLPATPDKMLCPSLLDLQYYPNGKHIPVPVNVPWKLRGSAVKKFVHNAGHGGLKGRNGTRELLEALRYVVKPISFLLRTQDKLDMGAVRTLMRANPKLDLRIEQGTVPADELYSTGDAFVFPEKFNGLSLPLQEAYASGMLVIAADRFPINGWLPPEPLVPVSGYNLTNVSDRCVNFNEAVIRPVDIARTIDAWYGKCVDELSLRGKAWAEAHSWDELKPQYMEFICG